MSYYKDFKKLPSPRDRIRNPKKKIFIACEGEKLKLIILITLKNMIYWKKILN